MGNACVFLISGKAGAGKTALANALAKSMDCHMGSIGVLSFASKIKEIARNDFGWDGVKDERGRALLQHLGAVGREYNEDIWVLHTINSIKSLTNGLYGYTIIDDWRFGNESKCLTSNGYDVIRIRVKADSRATLKGEQAKDTSEVSLPHWYVKNAYDIIVPNEIEDATDLSDQADLIIGQYL